MAADGIDATAVVHPAARIGAGTVVGPYCVIEDDVDIGPGCRLGSHVTVHGGTTLGPDNVVSPMAVLGGPPQDVSYRDEPTRLVVGRGNRIREFVTVHRASAKQDRVTTVGDGNLFMAYAHVAHDCRVGNHTVFANAASIAGHVVVEDGAFVGPFSGVHQFCRVGREAFIGGYSVLTMDALPWVTTAGNKAEGHGINVIGMRRRGYAAETVRALKRCYATLFRSKLRLEPAIERAERELGEVAEVRYFLDFVRASKRGVHR